MRQNRIYRAAVINFVMKSCATSKITIARWIESCNVRIESSWDLNRDWMKSPFDSAHDWCAAGGALRDAEQRHRHLQYVLLRLRAAVSQWLRTAVDQSRLHFQVGAHTDSCVFVILNKKWASTPYTVKMLSLRRKRAFGLAMTLSCDLWPLKTFPVKATHMLMNRPICSSVRCYWSAFTDYGDIALTRHVKNVLTDAQTAGRMTWKHKPLASFKT